MVWIVHNARLLSQKKLERCPRKENLHVKPDVTRLGDYARIDTVPFKQGTAKQSDDK
jgi:hypothetical protein